MSRFLKFIVHIIVICTVLSVIAMAVPPFFGVTTKIQDDSSSPSNLPVGSVTYGIPVASSQIQIGDSLLVTDEAVTYRYSLASYDAAEGRGMVVDPTVANAQPIIVAIRDYVPKAVLTIPFIGYLLMATKSMEGLIIIGLAILFLIILYVIAELWKKNPDADKEVLEDTEAGYIKSAKELKKEEKYRMRQLEQQEAQMLQEAKQQKRAAKKAGNKIRTGGFVDEVDASDFEDEEPMEQEDVREKQVRAATSEAHEELKKEIASATAAAAEEQAPPVRTSRTKRSAKPNLKNSRKMIDPSEEGQVPVKRLAIPRYSPEQLAEKARREGDNPDIVKDEVTDVTLFDYSDLFAEVEEDMQNEEE